jgi:hypothetical protein
MRSIGLTRSRGLAEETRRRNNHSQTASWPVANQTGTFRSPSAHEPARAPLAGPLPAPLLPAQRGAERRRYDRYAVRCECWIECDDTTVHGQAADLGLGGVFLRTAVPVAAGRHVDVVLVFGLEAQCVRARGIVTRTVAAERGRRHGLGIELTQIFEGAEALAKLGVSGVNTLSGA